MWTWDQPCINEIVIKRDGNVICSIINDNDNCSEEDFNNAILIVDTMNTAEIASEQG